MYRNHPAALLAAGKISESPLRRWPALAGQIGLIWATPPGLATKFARALKAGLRAPHAEALLDFPLWILHAPGSPPAQLLHLGLSTGLPLRGRVIAVLDEHAGSEQFRPLREQGALVATFWSAGTAGSGMPVFIEGQNEAVNRIRLLLRRAGQSSLRLEAGAKPRFVAARSLAQSLPVPLLDGIARCLQASGVSRPVAQRLALHWVGLQSRAYAASGRKGWTDPAHGGRQALVELGLDHLRAADPALAANLGRALEVCRALMKATASARKTGASKN